MGYLVVHYVYNYSTSSSLGLSLV